MEVAEEIFANWSCTLEICSLKSFLGKRYEQWRMLGRTQPVKHACIAAKKSTIIYPNKNHAGHLPLHSRNIQKAKLLKHRRPCHDRSDGWLCPKKLGRLKTKSYVVTNKHVKCKETNLECQYFGRLCRYYVLCAKTRCFRKKLLRYMRRKQTWPIVDSSQMLIDRCTGLTMLFP